MKSHTLTRIYLGLPDGKYPDDVAAFLTRRNINSTVIQSYGVWNRTQEYSCIVEIIDIETAHQYIAERLALSFDRDFVYTTQTLLHSADLIDVRPLKSTKVDHRTGVSKPLEPIAPSSTHNLSQDSTPLRGSPYCAECDRKDAYAGYQGAQSSPGVF